MTKTGINSFILLFTDGSRNIDRNPRHDTPQIALGVILPTYLDSSTIAGIGRYLMLRGAYFVNVDVWPSKGISPDLVSFSVCTIARSATTFTFQSGLTLTLFTS